MIKSLIFTFFLDGWLWSMTWGWYQLSLGLLFTWLLLIYISRIKSLPALILTITSYWSAFAVYTLFVALISTYIVQGDYVPEKAIGSTMIAVTLAIVFTLLQGVFFQLINQWYHLNFWQVLSITFIGNSMAALFVTYFMQFTLVTIG
jgi:hypothetical protein